MNSIKNIIRSMLALAPGACMAGENYNVTPLYFSSSSGIGLGVSAVKQLSYPTPDTEAASIIGFKCNLWKSEKINTDDASAQPIYVGEWTLTAEDKWPREISCAHYDVGNKKIMLALADLNDAVIIRCALPEKPGNCVVEKIYRCPPPTGEPGTVGRYYEDEPAAGKWQSSRGGASSGR